MRVDAQLLVVGAHDPLGLLVPNLGLEIEDLEGPVAGEEGVYRASEDVPLLLERHVHLRLDDPGHIRQVVVEVVHYLA